MAGYCALGLGKVDQWHSTLDGRKLDGMMMVEPTAAARCRRPPRLTDRHDCSQERRPDEGVGEMEIAPSDGPDA
jgi:hypothetical protein